MDKNLPLREQIITFLKEFKVKPCLQSLEYRFECDMKLEKTHNESEQCLCWYSHNKHDQRRPLIVRDNYYEYSPILCSVINEKKCSKPEKCEFAHNFWEQVIHPNFDFEHTQTNEDYVITDKVIQKYFPALKTLKKFLVIAKQELDGEFKYRRTQRRVKSFCCPTQKNNYYISLNQNAFRHTYQSYFWQISEDKHQSDKQEKSSAIDQVNWQIAQGGMIQKLLETKGDEDDKIEKIIFQENLNLDNHLDSKEIIDFYNKDIKIPLEPFNGAGAQILHMEQDDLKFYNNGPPGIRAQNIDDQQKMDQAPTQTSQKQVLSLSTFLPQFGVKEKAKIQNEIYEDEILKNFKTIKCTKTVQHNTKLCCFFHSSSDQRRSLKEFSYSAELCPNHKNCPNGDACLKSHNVVERLYHPTHYKTQLCKDHFNNGRCNYQDTCSFAHDISELQIELLDDGQQITDEFILSKYKTVYCPYFQCNQKHSCLYAHNIQDFRRSPDLYDYQPVKCPYWKTEDQNKFYYYGQCKYGKSCNKCHGWKELEYHPKVFKTKQCTTINCRNMYCPYSHQMTGGYSSNQFIQKPSYNNQHQFWQNEDQNHHFNQQEDNQCLLRMIKQPRQYQSNFQRPFRAMNMNYQQYSYNNQFQQQYPQKDKIFSLPNNYQPRSAFSQDDTTSNSQQRFLTPYSYRTRSGSFQSGEDNYNYSPGYSQYPQKHQDNLTTFTAQSQPVKPKYLPDFNPIQNNNQLNKKKQSFGGHQQQYQPYKVQPKIWEENNLVSSSEKQYLKEDYLQEQQQELQPKKRKFKTDSLNTAEEVIVKRLFKKLKGTNLEYIIEKLERFNVGNEQLLNMTKDDMQTFQITDINHQNQLRQLISELKTYEESDRIINDTSIWLGQSYQ